MAQKPNYSPPRRVIRMAGVIDLTSLKQARLHALIAQGLFPKPFKIVPGGRAAGWWEEEIHAWLEQRAVESRREELK